MVPELIPVLGSQPAGDVSHKLGGRLSLLSARPAITPSTLKRAATNFAAWWTEAQWVWTVCLRLLPDSVATEIWTRALLRLSPARYHSATEPPIIIEFSANATFSRHLVFFGAGWLECGHDARKNWLRFRLHGPQELTCFKTDGDNCIKSPTIFKILFTGKFSSKFTEK